MPVFLKQVQDAGFSGVQNFPTVGLCDGAFRANLEESGMGYGLEVDMIRTAHDMDLFTTPYAFNTDEAEAMAGAGADVVVAHMGLTTKGSIGATTAKTLDECVTAVQSVSDAACAVNLDVIVLCHGGPISMPEDAEYVLRRTKHVHGFYGASSAERLPVESAIKKQMEKFKAVRFA
jgi:predicted TIM-barrel enzyme